jgi:hypothetical protein
MTWRKEDIMLLIRTNRDWEEGLVESVDASPNLTA